MDLAENVELPGESVGEDDRPRKLKKSSAESRRSRSSRSADKIEKKTANKRKRPKLVEPRLPSPPPDPQAEMFAERIVSYENSASKAAASALGVDDAFDHLDKLHSLMEEILEMRERNAKLFRRVRDLERIKVTRKAHLEAERLISSGQDVVLPDEDVGFAESLLGAMLSSSFELSSSRNNVGRPIGSPKVTTTRSIGMEHRRVSCPVTIDTRLKSYNRPTLRTLESKKKRPSLAIGTPKVSKWTRVKAAFKWERAACTNNDLPTEPEVNVRYLKIPENTTGSSEVSGPPTPAGTMSSSSSIDDVFHRPQRPSSNQSTRMTRRDENSDPARRSRSLDGDASVPMNFVYSSRPSSKDNSGFQGKSVDPRNHKTPWGKVKGMMQLRRDSIGRLPARSISRNGDGHSTSSLDSSDIHRSEQHVDGRPPRVRISCDSNIVHTGNIIKSTSSNVPNDFVDLATRRLTPTLTITVPSSEELRSFSSPESVTPSPPSPRQSFESGKSERFSQSGYETPKDTRTGQVSPASSSSGILRYGLGRSKTCQGVPNAGDYKRQQSLKGESLSSSPKMQRRDSKWNKVKRAFLTSATSVPTSPNRVSSYFFDDGDATGCSYSASASAEDLENESATSPGVQAEIQRNYRLLHDKFGTEFYRKLAEWERLKSHNASIRDSSRSNARERDNENLRLLGEERLTPEFKKKLEEWNRMNKGAGDHRGPNTNENRSVNRRRITDWQLWKSSSKTENKTEGPRLSEDFIKKMEEWKRIKSATSRRDTEVEINAQGRKQRREDGDDEEEGDDDGEEEEEEDRESILDIRLSEKRRRAWKSLEDEEFKSLEKVLEALEMDRQTRLSKLQRIVGSQPQKAQEVLIHTSTGLYRFEGISRKFTRKLYEWEKSQGISPELSTFRLLDPLRHGVGSLRTRATVVDETEDGVPRKKRHRSKSVGCVDIDSWRTKRDTEKSTIRRPCSLSLNDIDNIDARSCIIASSIPTIPDEEDTSEDVAMEDSEAEPEPEAVIVDIEDVIEETASPLRKYQPHQTPVYSVASSETTSIAVPLGTVTARHEPSPIILIEPGEINPLRARACSINGTQNELFCSQGNNEEPVTSGTISSANSSPSSIESQQRQRSIAGGLTIKRQTFHFDDNGLSAEGNIESGDSQIIGISVGQSTEEQEDSSGNWQMTSPTNVNSEPRTFLPSERLSNDEDESYEDAVITVRSNMRHSKKLLKTRRLTDTYVGYDWLMKNHPSTSKSTRSDFRDDRDNDDNSLSEINDEFEDNPNVERIIINEDTLNKIVVPTASSSSALSATLKLDEDTTSDRDAGDSSRKEKREATSVFVKTKRIVFSPFRREAKNKTIDNSQATENPLKYNENCVTEKPNELTKSDTNKNNFPSIKPKEAELTERSVLTDTSSAIEIKRPPVPKSPILARKDYAASSAREKSPSIRMMIRRYNDKLEIENCERRAGSFSPIVTTTSSATSSGSGSSTPGWRTPLAERKSLNRPDRYDEAKKVLSPRKVSSEASGRSFDHTAIVLSKSSSTNFLRQRSSLDTRRERTMEPEFLAMSVETSPERFELRENQLSASNIRAMKIRQAKEHFLAMNQPENSMIKEKRKKDTKSQPAGSRDIGEDTRQQENDEKRISITRNDIVKSVSVGMINIDEGTYERLQIAGENEAERSCDSLPRSDEHLPLPETKNSTTSKFSQIANKFKKARLRRTKDKQNSGMSTVLKLCRQSLLVDIATNYSSSTTEAGSSNSSMGTNDTTTSKKEDADRKNDGKRDDYKS